MPEHVGLVKYGFLVINLLVFFTGNLPKRINFSFLSLHLDLIAVLQMYMMEGGEACMAFRAEKKCCAYTLFSGPPFTCQSLTVKENSIFLQAYGLKGTSGKMSFLVLYRSAGKAMV